jgi:hypothetical protein
MLGPAGGRVKDRQKAGEDHQKMKDSETSRPASLKAPGQLVVAQFAGGVAIDYKITPRDKFRCNLIQTV